MVLKIYQVKKKSGAKPKGRTGVALP